MEDKLKGEPLLEAFIADIETYRSGELVGFWHSFPTTKEDLQTAIEENSFAGVNFKNYFIYDYKICLDGEYRQFTDSGDIEEVNFLAIKLEQMSPSQLLILDSVLEVNPSFHSLTDVINMVENVDNYCLKPVFSTHRYGEFLIDELREQNSETLIRLQQSENINDRNLVAYIEKLESHFDFQKFAKEQENAENGFYSSKGYLAEIGELTFKFRGVKNIPEEYRIFTYPEKISVLDKLAGAKAESVKNEKTDKAEKSNEAEL